VKVAQVNFGLRDFHFWTFSVPCFANERKIALKQVFAAAMLTALAAPAFAEDYLCQMKHNGRDLPLGTQIIVRAGNGNEALVVDEIIKEVYGEPLRASLHRGTSLTISWNLPIKFVGGEVEIMNNTMYINLKTMKAQLGGRFQHATNRFTARGTCVAK
jgi:hypothetical protein